MGIGTYTLNQRRLARRIETLSTRLSALYRRVDNYCQHRKNTLLKYKLMLDDLKKELQDIEQISMKGDKNGTIRSTTSTKKTS
jgi:hypothetical protein